MISGILFGPPSVKYESAQQMSVITSGELFCSKILHRDGIALAIMKEFAAGLPLHKLESAQLAFLQKLVPILQLSRRSEINATAPESITKSL